MQLPHRPPMSQEEIELIKAKTRQTKLTTWLASLNLSLLFLIIGIPACLGCVGCLAFLILTGIVAISLPEM
jgi:hypothetical protein